MKEEVEERDGEDRRGKASVGLGCEGWKEKWLRGRLNGEWGFKEGRQDRGDPLTKEEPLFSHGDDCEQPELRGIGVQTKLLYP